MRHFGWGKYQFSAPFPLLVPLKNGGRRVDNGVDESEMRHGKTRRDISETRLQRVLTGQEQSFDEGENRGRESGEEWRRGEKAGMGARSFRATECLCPNVG